MNEKPYLLVLFDSSTVFEPQFDPRKNALKKSHFQISFLFTFSLRKTQALEYFYAFCRLVDDIADEPGLSLEKREQFLNEIENWIREPQRTAHPYWDAFAEIRTEFQIENSDLLAILEGVRIDLRSKEIGFKTWDELNDYVYGVACSVGLVVLSILGVRGANAFTYSLQMGRCVQYLNIMRDLEEDLANGRIYIPEEFLRGRSLEDILSEARTELYGRALVCRDLAIPHSWKQLSAEMMGEIYLEGSKKYWRFGNPQRLSLFQKLFVALRTFLKCLKRLPV